MAPSYPHGTFVAPTVQHGKNCPKQATPLTIPPKKLKVSKRRPSTAMHILLVHVSIYILKKKAPQNSPVAPSYPPGTFIAPPKILRATVAVKPGEPHPPTQKAHSEQEGAYHGQTYPFRTCFKGHCPKKDATKLTGGAKLPPRDICCTHRATWKKLPKTGDPPYYPPKIAQSEQETA